MSLKSGPAPAGTSGPGQGERAAKGHAPTAHGFRFRRLRNAAIGIVVLGFVFWGVASWVDRVGWKFFHTGEGLTKRLAEIAGTSLLVTPRLSSPSMRPTSSASRWA